MRLLRNLILIVLVIASTMMLIACGDDALQRAVDIFNSDEELHNDLAGLFIVYAEAKDGSTMVVTFRAEDEEVATIDVAEAGANAAAPLFRAAVNGLRNARISDPKVIVEFLDMSGALIYSREFS